MKRIICLCLFLFFITPIYADSLSIIAKGFGGGNYLQKPDQNALVFPNAEEPFEQGGGGWAAGGGIAAEYRILDNILGLETGLLFDHSEVWCSIKYNGLVDTEYLYKTDSLRIPLMLKANVGSSLIKATFGLGLEFAIGVGSDLIYSVEGKPSEFGAFFLKMKDQTDVLFAAQLGFIVLVNNINITFDVKYAYNMTQPSKYPDFIKNESDRTEYTMVASNSMEGRVMLGAGYQFDFPNIF